MELYRRISPKLPLVDERKRILISFISRYLLAWRIPNLTTRPGRLASKQLLVPVPSAINGKPGNIQWLLFYRGIALIDSSSTKVRCETPFVSTILCFSYIKVIRQLNDSCCNINFFVILQASIGPDYEVFFLYLQKKIQVSIEPRSWWFPTWRRCKEYCFYKFSLFPFYSSKTCA